MSCRVVPFDDDDDDDVDNDDNNTVVVIPSRSHGSVLFCGHTLAIARIPSSGYWSYGITEGQLDGIRRRTTAVVVVLNSRFVRYFHDLLSHETIPPGVVVDRDNDDDEATEVQTNYVSSQYFVTITTKSKIILNK